MANANGLNIGDTSYNGQVTIIDEDRLCYLVKSASRGAIGLRTISKALLKEFVAFIDKHPEVPANEVRFKISGQSDIDKYEYGYGATISIMAKMLLGQERILRTTEEKKKELSRPLQQIFYGAPGTGKSHKVKEVTDELPKSDVFRTTFHPDSDYSTFIGCYKPKMVKAPIRDSSGHEITSACEEEKKRIAYEYEPQAFLKAYVRAYETNEPVFLVIEEINRGNCAQIFGDMFQLLDRNEKGESDYTIKPETAIQEFLNEKLKDCDIEDEAVKSGEEMRLPANLYIWATMNTSDQSLFPIDSAFKRRWDWKYMPIKYSNKDWKINLAGNTSVEWVKLQQELNELIYDATESEDKMLGDWFVKANTNNEISEEELVGKIIFYLWNDVARVDAGNLFNLEIEKHGRKCKVTFSDFYNNNGSINSDVVKKWLKQIKVLKEPAEDRQDTPDNETSSTANSPIDQE